MMPQLLLRSVVWSAPLGYVLALQERNLNGKYITPSPEPQLETPPPRPCFRSAVHWPGGTESDPAMESAQRGRYDTLATAGGSANPCTTYSAR